MENSKLERINELAHLAKERALTEEELAERDALRKEYIAAWRESTIAVLEASKLPEVGYFLEHFIPAFELNLDELGTIE